MNREERKRQVAQEDRTYLEFIDELRKAARLDSQTAEISRVYKEVIDILTEAFDAYDPQELPQYQNRLSNLIDVVKREDEFKKDPLFLEDLDKATEILSAKVKRRWSTFAKLKTLGAVTMRAVGGSNALVQDILDIGDRAESIGRNVGSIFKTKTKATDEESRTIRDVIKGNDGQYGNWSPSPSTGGGPGGALAKTPTSAVPVKDDKLIGTNTVQNKVLTSLLDVSKDSNSNIKDIKKILLTQEKQRDDLEDASALNNLENKQEGNALVAVKNDRKLLQNLLGTGATGEAASGGPVASEQGGGGGMADMLAEGYAIKKGAEWIGKGAKGAWGAAKGVAKKAAPLLRKAGPAVARALPWLGRGAATVAGGAATAAASPAVATAAAVAGTAYTAYEAGGLINDYVVDPAVKTLGPKLANVGQSIAATIGEKTKGIDYYKQLFRQGGLEGESQEKAEQWALDFLLKIATDKEKLLKKSFKDGSRYGDGSYKIDNKPVALDEAQKDVQTAKEQYEQYKNYLAEKKKKGGLTATAKFKGSDGQVYTNPLFKGEEQPPVVPQQNSQEMLRTTVPQESPAPSTPSSDAAASALPSSNSQVRNSPESTVAGTSKETAPGAADSQGVVANPTVEQNRQLLSNLHANKASLEKNFNAQIGKALIKGDTQEAKKLSEERDAAVSEFYNKNMAPLEKQIAGQNQAAYESRMGGKLTEFSDQSSNVSPKVKENVLKSKQGEPSPEITGKSFNEKAPKVMERLQNDLNITKEDAAAIVGNLGHESAGLKPNINEAKPVVPGSRGGYGWAQWTGSRRKAFEQFASENNLDPSSDEANYQYLVHELKGSEKGALKALRGADGIEDKTRAFEASYERAGVKHHDSRIKYAKRALDAGVINPDDVTPSSREPIQMAMSNLSRESDMAQVQPIVLTQNGGGHGRQEEPMPSASMKSIGAPANGASEATLMVALRQSISPLA